MHIPGKAAISFLISSLTVESNAEAFLSFAIRIGTANFKVTISSEQYQRGITETFFYMYFISSTCIISLFFYITPNCQTLAFFLLLHYFIALLGLIQHYFLRFLSWTLTTQTVLPNITYSYYVTGEHFPSQEKGFWEGTCLFLPNLWSKCSP